MSDHPIAPFSVLGTASPTPKEIRCIRDTISYDPKTLKFSLHAERGSYVDGKWVASGERQDITHKMTQQDLHDMAVFDFGMRLPIQDAPRAD